MSVAAAAPPVPFAPPLIDRAAIAEVVDTLESGWLSTGPKTHRFEQEFAAYVGAPHAIALNSCTAGLHLSLLAAGVGPGDEVITSPLTFVATANAVVHTGARPVFADVDPATGNLDPAAAAAAVTPRTRAVIAVHYAGLPADVDALGSMARRHGLITIEDAAHCIEGVANGRKVGTTADFTCFSFYATKNLTTGEGGMVTTASTAAADSIRTASLHGMTRDAWARYRPGARPGYDVPVAGFKYNMGDLQASLGLHQLRAIERHHQRRVSICRRYDEALLDLPIAKLADPLPGTVHARHLYPILVRPHAGVTRDQLAAALGQQGIASSVHFPPVHLHSFYRQTFGYSPGAFPCAERIAAAVLSLPLSPALTDDQIDRVIAAVRETLRGR